MFITDSTHFPSSSEVDPSHSSAESHSQVSTKISHSARPGTDTSAPSTRRQDMSSSQHSHKSVLSFKVPPTGNVYQREMHTAPHHNKNPTLLKRSVGEREDLFSSIVSSSSKLDLDKYSSENADPTELMQSEKKFFWEETLMEPEHHGETVKEQENKCQHQ